MKVLVGVLSIVMDLGVQGHILYPGRQFKTTNELIVGEIEEVVDPTKEEDLLMLDDPGPQMNTMFEVNAKAVHYVRVPRIYQSDPQVKCLYHISFAYCAMHS